MQSLSERQRDIEGDTTAPRHFQSWGRIQLFLHPGLGAVRVLQTSCTKLRLILALLKYCWYFYKETDFRFTQSSTRSFASLSAFYLFLRESLDQTEKIKINYVEMRSLDFCSNCAPLTTGPGRFHCTSPAKAPPRLASVPVQRSSPASWVHRARNPPINHLPPCSWQRAGRPAMAPSRVARQPAPEGCLRTADKRPSGCNNRLLSVKNVSG